MNINFEEFVFELWVEYNIKLVIESEDVKDFIDVGKFFLKFKGWMV